MAQPLEKSEINLTLLFISGKKLLNVNAEDQNHKTPLMYALENNHTEIHQLLLSYAGLLAISISFWTCRMNEV